MYKEIVPPQEGYPLDNGEAFVEDMEAFMWKTKISMQEFDVRFRNRVSKKDRDYLTALYSRGSASDGDLYAEPILIKNKYRDSWYSSYVSSYLSGYDSKLTIGGYFNIFVRALLGLGYTENDIEEYLCMIKYKIKED